MININIQSIIIDFQQKFYDLLNKINTNNIAGPTAFAITAVGDTELIAKPEATAVKVSKLTIPTNIKNRIGFGFKLADQ